MTQLPWTPWHQVVHIRDDLRSGELSLAAFAADLYDVAMRKGRRPIYEDPAQFFALTYPTYTLRELARDVVQRLAGQNDKAVRQLELTYGGGKTHTLIALYHLVADPAALPDLPAVHEFVQHIGITPPQARVALLPFDKLDVEKGMEVRGPAGEQRWLKHPWSAIALQIAGADGLRLLHAEGQDAERESPPAENLLVELLAIPEKEGLSTLILIDEVLMYAREKVGLDPAWRGRLIDFFQYLTQAVTKVDRCALVASLLATDPRKSDTLGKELTQELYAIFRREKEEGVQPVLKEDVAEVLRRRFFTPESIHNRDPFKAHVVAALKGITALDEQTAAEGKNAEARFLASYPFHPDLTDLFYTKWTNLEGFQRTRGVLRTFALALRDAEAWDASPLIGANVFLAAPGADELSPDSLSAAARELTSIAETEEYEGKRHAWSAILLGELAKARAIQGECPALVHREVERAVFATFMHSQPVGQKALARDLMVLLGQTRPDRIELEKALRRWTELSWFLDEDVAYDGSAQEGALPRAWRLGSRPNLTQMHHDACQNRVPPELVETKLKQEIDNLNSLTAGAKGAGARVHTMPTSPAQVQDDGDFHFVILPPEAANDPGQPHELAKRFLTETTTPDKPRVNKNAVVLVTPSPAGLEQARQAVLQCLGWEDVRGQLQKQDLAKMDPLRWQMLLGKLSSAQKGISGAIRQAYSVVVTLSAAGQAEAFRVKVDDGPLFAAVKEDRRSRIQETAVSAEALLPGGPYELWHEGESARWLKDLVGAFAQHPHLPKMLDQGAILDTLVGGCVAGLFVFRLARPDGSVRTFWRERPDDAMLKEAAMEVVLPEAATLSSLAPSLLLPGSLPGLWPDGDAALSVQATYDYFTGGNVIMVPKEGYEEPVAIPAAPHEVVDQAINQAVETGKLWLLSGPASLCGETIPAGVLTSSTALRLPPEPVTIKGLLPDNLPEAWSADTTSALALATALSARAGATLPWPAIQKAVEGAFNAHYLERTVDSGPWPCGYAGAGNVKVRIPVGAPPPPPPPPPGVRVAEADLETYQLQDLAEVVSDLKTAAAGHELKIHVRFELGGHPSGEVVAKIDGLLQEVDPEFKFK
ncbi:MAG: ATP-binding protein [Anaerolineae bacterium]|nr:ATP-binding protein [Anaerolineae bacterium]